MVIVILPLPLQFKSLWLRSHNYESERITSWKDLTRGAANLDNLQPNTDELGCDS